MKANGGGCPGRSPGGLWMDGPRYSSTSRCENQRDVKRGKANRGLGREGHWGHGRDSPQGGQGGGGHWGHGRDSPQGGRAGRAEAANPRFSA